MNAAVDASIRVSLDGHTMQVITSDFIPIKPWATQTLLLAIGQRYDVTITANQEPGNYWFRASNAGACLSSVKNNALAIWTYAGTPPATPSSTSWTFPADCLEPTNLAPYWVQPVPSANFLGSVDKLMVNTTRAVTVPGGDAIVVWALNHTSMNIAWDRPTLQYIMDNPSAAEYPNSYHVIATLNAGAWNYWIIQQLATAPPIPHPIHLHGHDFFVLGQEGGQFDSDPSSTSFKSLNFATPPRRDTASVPGGGWLVLAFPSNNPGVWLMHCHIAWHVSQGLAVQFVESPESIVMPDRAAWEQTCANHKAFEGSEQKLLRQR